MTESVNFITGVVAGFFIGSFVSILMLIVSEPIGGVVEKVHKIKHGELLKATVSNLPQTTHDGKNLHNRGRSSRLPVSFIGGKKAKAKAVQ